MHSEFAGRLLGPLWRVPTDPVWEGAAVAHHPLLLSTAGHTGLGPVLFMAVHAREGGPERQLFTNYSRDMSLGPPLLSPGQDLVPSFWELWERKSAADWGRAC